MEKKVNFIQDLLEKFGDPDSAINHLKSATEASPVGARLDLQVFLNAVGREEESFAVSNELIKLAPEDPRVLFNHGWHWLKRNQMQKGMALLEFGRTLNTYGHQRLPSSRPLWTPETGRGHRVHLVLEGGFGDEIIHFRFCKDLVEKYDCKVTVVCHPSMATVFANSPYVSAVMQREVATGVYHDSWLPGMSAALALGYEHKDLSGEKYLSPRPVLTSKWKSLISTVGKGKLKVGIRWAGNPAFEHQQFRSFPPEILTSLVDLQDVQLFSFQKDDNLVKLNESIMDLGPHLSTWDDTIAALSEMDLVISSCTSVAHASAATGVKTWVLVPALPYFVWALEGDTSPWYNSVKLYRQQKFGTWNDVGDKLRNDLSELVRK
jgi:hypothetical protein